MRTPRFKPGTAIGTELTFVAQVSDDGPNPVSLVWHHRAFIPVACKVFASRYGARREAAVLGSLCHPNIVRCLGVSKPACLLMEFLEGPTLSRYIRTCPRGRIPLSDAIRIAIHIGSGLLHMHARGYLHLDVKPANIIITRGRPVLFDLGSAEPLRHDRIRGPIGTDEYMAPEQVRGGRLTPAADVFGLGATLFRMLSGEFPFPREARRRLFPQVSEPPASLRSHVNRIPIALDSLVARCLARNPKSRPELRELLPELHQFIRSGPRMWPAEAEIAAGSQSCRIGGRRPDQPVTPRVPT